MPSGKEDLRQFTSSLRASGVHCNGPGGPSGEPGQVTVSIRHLPPIRPAPLSTAGPNGSFASGTETKDGNPVTPPGESASKFTKFVDILSSSKLSLDSLDINSRNVWFGIKFPLPTTLNLTLHNAWILSDSQILEGLVKLHLDCDRSLSVTGPLAAEWLLTMLSKTKNLRDCTLHLEDAAISSSFARPIPKVSLEKIKKFDVSHHWAQIQTLFSSLTLPETAKVNISTTVTKSDPDNTLDQVVFPPNWPTNKQAWEQGKLKLDLSLDAVKYRIGDNHTVTVKHGRDEDARTLSPSVVSGHGNPEGRVTDLEVSFGGGVEGVNSELWDDILRSNTKLVNLTCSNIKIQDLCESLDRQEELGGVQLVKCPELCRLVLLDPGFTVDDPPRILTSMHGKREGLKIEDQKGGVMEDGRMSVRELS